MKKIYFCLLFCFISTLSVFGIEAPTYKIIENTSFYDFDYDHYYELSKLKSGAPITLGENWSFLINEYIYATDGIHIGEIKPEVAVPINTKDLFDKSLLYSNFNITNRWVPVYYLNILEKKNSSLLLEYENIPYIVDESDLGYDTWEDRFTINGYLKISNILIGIGYGNGCIDNLCFDLNIITIEKIQEGYSVSVANGKSVQKSYFSLFSSCIPQYSDYTIYRLLFIFDGDYLSIYVNDRKTLLQTFIKINLNTKSEFEKLIKTGDCDLSKVTWPRYADGSCDYEPSNKQLASKIAPTAQPQNNVSLDKLMTASDNLRLRSAEETSSSIITTMQKGTSVKVIKLGKLETIDGITSNWVQIEVQSGKDRDDKTLKKGTIGWCFGGYLEELDL